MSRNFRSEKESVQTMFRRCWPLEVAPCQDSTDGVHKCKGITLPLRFTPKGVRGSYSARVPRSSLARVRRVLVPHIMEEEDERQENEKDDRREDGQQRVEGRVAENQNNHHERMKMG